LFELRFKAEGKGGSVFLVVSSGLVVALELGSGGLFSPKSLRVILSVVVVNRWLRMDPDEGW